MFAIPDRKLQIERSPRSMNYMSCDSPSVGGQSIVLRSQQLGPDILEKEIAVHPRRMMLYGGVGSLVSSRCNISVLSA